MFKYAQKEHHIQNSAGGKKKNIHSKNKMPMYTRKHFEDLSGSSFDDVRVNYNSSNPTQLNTLAYTQENNVYTVPGMKKTFPPELGHVVQQNYKYNGSVIQRYKESEGYQAGAYRYMRCEGSDRPFVDLPVEKNQNNLAILYEVIVYDKDAHQVKKRFEDKFNSEPCRNDVALSLVVNHKVGDQGISRDSLILADKTNRPLINVERVIWGMINEREPDNTNRSNESEQIPYYSLRRRAAINPGATQLETLLRKNSANLWRRMCDSDISFHDPMDSNDQQMNVMREKAQEKYFATKMVTFGYILETPPGDYDNFFNSGRTWLTRIPSSKREMVKKMVIQKLNKFIDLIYQYEAEFRQELNQNGLEISPGYFLPHHFDYYPCEPSTYYRFNEYDLKSDYWTSHSEQQIAEGRTFKKNYIKQNGTHDFVYQFDTLERTGAGKRHKDFIQEFLKDSHINCKLNLQQIHFTIPQEDLFVQIQKLEQSYFNPSTHGIKQDNLAAFNNRVCRFLNEKQLYQKLQEDEYIVKWM